MKPLLQRRTPAQLLWIITASNALVIIGFGVLSLPSWRHGGLSVSLWCSLAAIFLGLTGSFLTEQVLRDGIYSEKWPDSLLVVPRKLSSHPAYSILNGLLIVGTVAYMVTFGLHESGAVWVFLLPAMTLTRIQSYLRPKPPSDRLILLQPIEQSKTLQSKNWGIPPRPFSN